MKRDLDFISGRFFEEPIPKEKRFLLKYFTTDLQIAFLRYYLVFGTINNFSNHTGFSYPYPLIRRLEIRYLYLTKIYEDAKTDISEESLKLIHQIESGKFSLSKCKIIK